MLWMEVYVRDRKDPRRLKGSLWAEALGTNNEGTTGLNLEQFGKQNFS